MMDDSVKLERLRGLSEERLRREVLIPLLGRLGYLAASEYHGAREHGKDIVCYETDKLGERRYLAVVAKTTDLTGSASKSAGLSEVINQVEQSFNEAYVDLFGMRSVTMDQVWVVTSGKIVSAAGDSITGKLQKYNLTKLVRIISGERLVTLLNEHYSSYWDAAAETVDYVRGQRDRLKRFSESLLSKVAVPEQSADEILNSILNSSAWTPTVVAVDPRYHARHASTYSVAIEKSESPYPKGLVSTQCGEMAEALEEARDKVRHAVMDLEETLDKVSQVIAQSDPHKFLELFEDLEDDYPFHRSSYTIRADGALKSVEYLQYGVEDVDDFLSRLSSGGRKEEYLALVASLTILEPDMVRFLATADKPKLLLSWRIVPSEPPRIEPLYDAPAMTGQDIFSTNEELEMEETRRQVVQMRRVTAREVITNAQYALRKHFEEKMGFAAPE